MKALYKIGPRGGLRKVGDCGMTCDVVTALGRRPQTGERFVFGKGRTESDRRAWAQTAPRIEG